MVVSGLYGEYSITVNPRRVKMPSARPALFCTVPEKDNLGFWAGPRLKAEAVVDFLEFKKADVAKIAGVSLASVRFDQKIPKQVRDRLMQLATLCELVAQYFGGDVEDIAMVQNGQSVTRQRVSTRDDPTDPLRQTASVCDGRFGAERRLVGGELHGRGRTRKVT